MWVIDFETYFDNEYTLSKMTTEAYVRDPRFEISGVGLLCVENSKITAGEFFAGDSARGVLQYGRIKWEDETVLCHHAHFDGLILSCHYGVRPGKWLDILSMANLVHGVRRSKSLAALAEHYNLPAKNVPYDLFKGKHWADLTTDKQQQVANGCLHDCELTFMIYDRMKALIPQEEYDVIDLTVRMFTEPKLIGDQPLLYRIRDEEGLAKNQRLYELGVGEKELASNAKFAALLKAEGVEVPMKRGKDKPDGTPKWIPAVAKSDPFMQELQESDDEQIASLVQARLEVRSTLNETRAGRLASMAGRGALPVYLHYSGAHTRRWSGGDALNFQNFPRNGNLRRSLRAPEGRLIACPDQSQGECRILNWLAGQDDIVERFRAGLNPYEPIASKFYERLITKAADPAEYGTGKQLELSCGYGAGAETIIRTAARGAYGPPVHLTLEEGIKARDLYRDTHPAVVVLWAEGKEVLSALASKTRFMSWRGCLTLDDGRLVGPTGLWIDYSTLRYEEHEWRLYGQYGGYRKMYGAKLVQNVIELLSRIVTSQAMLRFKAAGYSIVGMSHDDVWLLVPKDGKEHLHKSEIIEIMAQTPDWAPGLPLAADCKMGETYT